LGRSRWRFSLKGDLEYEEFLWLNKEEGRKRRWTKEKKRKRNRKKEIRRRTSWKFKGDKGRKVWFSEEKTIG